MIEIKHISKQFDTKIILDDISAQFKPGMCNLIIGASGSGKTVLTKCIVDLIQPDKGEVIFDGVVLSGMDKEDRKELRNNIGMLFQGNALFDSLTVEENVRFPLDMFSELSIEEKKIKVMPLITNGNFRGGRFAGWRNQFSASGWPGSGGGSILSPGLCRDSLYGIHRRVPDDLEEYRPKHRQL